MPKNKEALIRYRIIDSIIRNKHKPYPAMDDIIDALEDKLGTSFSKSTVQKDIKTMKEDEALGYLAPIAYSRAHDGYYYTDENYTIASVPLNVEDIQAIDFAAMLLEQFKTVPIFRQYTAAVDKIMEAVNIKRALGEDYKEETFIQFEQVPYQEGSDYLSEIIEYIKERKVISFEYRRFDADEPKKHVVHPYFLKEFRNRWYLLGLNNEFDLLLTYGLDRISNIMEEQMEFRFHPDFDPQKYFQYAYGIYRHDGDPQEIILSFTPVQGKYIKTQPLHHSQEVLKDDKKEFRIKLHVWPTYDLKMQILSYGPNVKVISPDDFANDIKEALEKTLEQYH